jgi:ketosteroid isomerase-like protein
MTTETDQLPAVQRILHATDHDIEGFLGFFTDTTVFRMGSADQVVGREAIAQWVGGYLASVTGTSHDVLRIWEAEDAVAVQMDVTYRMRSGQGITLPAITEMRFRDGTLTHYLIFMDPSPVVAAS